MNRTFTLCFLLYPIALPFGYVLVYTFYHYAVPDANSNITNANTNQNKGVIGLDSIDTLSSPSQLTHNGFYDFGYCSADVNNNLDSGAGSFTDYATGDFQAILLTNHCTKEKGCRYGTLIVISPRFTGYFWIARIWEFKFIHWHKASGS